MFYKAAIFDMDGTLLNTLADLADSVNEMLAHYNLPPRTIDEVRMFVGNGARKLMERALETTDADFVNEALNYYNGCYERHLTNKTEPYAGIVELLKNLNAKNIPIHVFKPSEAFVIKLLSMILFTYVVWTSTPGYTLSTGTDFISKRLAAVAPKYTILL